MNLPRPNQPAVGSPAFANQQPQQQAFLRAPSCPPLQLRGPISSGTDRPAHRLPQPPQQSALYTTLSHAQRVVHPFPFHSVSHGGGEPLLPAHQQHIQQQQQQQQQFIASNNWPNRPRPSQHQCEPKLANSNSSNIQHLSASPSSSSSATGTPAGAESMHNPNLNQIPHPVAQHIHPVPHQQHPAQHVIGAVSQPAAHSQGQLQQSGPIAIPSQNGSLPQTPATPNSQPTVGIMYGHPMQSAPRLPGHPGFPMPYPNLMGQPRAPYNHLTPVTVPQQIGQPNIAAAYHPMLIWNTQPYAVFSSQQAPTQALAQRPPVQATPVVTPGAPIPHAHDNNVQSANNAMPPQPQHPAMTPNLQQAAQPQTATSQPLQQQASFPLQPTPPGTFFTPNTPFYIPPLQQPATAISQVANPQQPQQQPTASTQPNAIPLHQPLPATRYPQGEQKRSHAIPIVNPVSLKDITPEIKKSAVTTGDSDAASQGSSSRTTPGAPPAVAATGPSSPQNPSVREEFIKQVNLRIKAEASSQEIPITNSLDAPNVSEAAVSISNTTSAIVPLMDSAEPDLNLSSNALNGAETVLTSGTIANGVDYNYITSNEVSVTSDQKYDVEIEKKTATEAEVMPSLKENVENEAKTVLPSLPETTVCESEMIATTAQKRDTNTIGKKNQKKKKINENAKLLEEKSELDAFITTEPDKTESSSVQEDNEKLVPHEIINLTDSEKIEKSEIESNHALSLQFEPDKDVSNVENESDSKVETKCSIEIPAPESATEEASSDQLVENLELESKVSVQEVLDNNKNKISGVDNSTQDESKGLTLPDEPEPSAADLLVKALQPNGPELEELEEGEIVDDEDDDQNSEKEATPAKDVDKNSSESLVDDSSETATSAQIAYDADQWSPANPSGKRVYDRSFLLNLQFIPISLTKPDQLPQISDVILDKPRMAPPQTPTTQGPPMMGGGPPGGIPFNVFDPPYMPKTVLPAGFSRGMISHGPGGSLRGERRPEQRGVGPHGQQMGRMPSKSGQPKVISLGRSLGGDVKLNTAENAWKPSIKAPKVNEPSEKIQHIYKIVRGILNKLTPQKFAPLVKQLLDLDIKSEETLKGVIDIIFEKAIDEPGFSVAYANMCKHLILVKVPDVDGSSQEGGRQTKNDVNVYFRKLLINRCQKEFEAGALLEIDFEAQLKDIAAIEDEKERAEAEENYQVKAKKAKRRYLGNIRFIGELFKLKMLTENIMHDCIMKLLTKKEDKNKDRNDEESLECLCRLMSTIGKDLDVDIKGSRARLDTYFKEMDKIIKAKKASSRVRFMLMDVVELRKNRWVPRRDDNNPKTIDEIHEQAQKEEQEMYAKLAESKIKERERKAQQAREGRSGTPASSSRPNEDGWMTVPTASKQKIDPSRMKLTKPGAIDENNLQLGPGGRPGGWNRGSLGGASAKNTESDRPQGPGNRFGLLSGPESGVTLGPRGHMDSRGPSSSGRLTPSREQAWPTQPGLRGPSGVPPPPIGKRPPSGAREIRDRDEIPRTHDFMPGFGRPNSRPSSRPGSREGSRSRDTVNSLQSGDKSRGSSPFNSNSPTPPPMPRAPLPPANKASQALKPPQLSQSKKQLSNEELEKRLNNIVDEFALNHDTKEALSCVEELDCGRRMHEIVNIILMHVLERNSKLRLETGLLFYSLVKAGQLSPEDFVKGASGVIDNAEDLMVDIPWLWDYLGEIFCGLINLGGHFPLKHFGTLCASLKPIRCAGKFIAAILKHAVNTLGQQTVSDCWRGSGLSIAELVAPENSADFLKNNKLEFLSSTSKAVNNIPSSKQTPSFGLLSQELQARLKRGEEFEQTKNWIEAKVDQQTRTQPFFYRMLMTAAVSSSVSGESTTASYDPEKLRVHSQLLRHFFGDLLAAEKQAVFALQAFVHSLQHPPNLLQKIFDTCYDEDIISEAAFRAWHEASDEEEEGKGVAMKSVVQFFRFLQEAEEVED